MQRILYNTGLLEPRCHQHAAYILKGKIENTIRKLKKAKTLDEDNTAAEYQTQRRSYNGSVY